MSDETHEDRGEQDALTIDVGRHVEAAWREASQEAREEIRDRSFSEVRGSGRARMTVAGRIEFESAVRNFAISLQQEAERVASAEGRGLDSGSEMTANTILHAAQTMGSSPTTARKRIRSLYGAYLSVVSGFALGFGANYLHSIWQLGVFLFLVLLGSFGVALSAFRS